MSRRFPNRPQSTLSAQSGLDRQGGRLERFVLGERIIISRALCHFETMPVMPGGASFRRHEAVKLSARARTPIPDPEFHFDWGDERIGIWSWPKSLTSDLKDFEGEVLPETVLHTTLDDGARLVAAIDGYEGQVWRNAELIASRWWPTLPTALDWSAFLRATRSSEVSQTPPSPEPAIYLPHPARKAPYTAMLDRLRSIHLRDITALATALIAIPGLYLIGEWAQLSLSKASAEAELEQLSVQTAQISAARQDAQSAANELAQYAEILNQRHPAALLASVSAELAEFSIRLDYFEQADQTLRISMFASETFAPESVVRAMESNPLMSNVNLEPGRGSNEWVLTAELERIQ
jgi:Tfp pilus assembly protein PilN